MVCSMELHDSIRVPRSFFFHWRPNALTLVSRPLYFVRYSISTTPALAYLCNLYLRNLTGKPAITNPKAKTLSGIQPILSSIMT